MAKKTWFLFKVTHRLCTASILGLVFYTILTADTACKPKRILHSEVVKKTELSSHLWFITSVTKMAAKEHLPSRGAIYISYSSVPSSDGEIQHTAGRVCETRVDCQATVLTFIITNSCRRPQCPRANKYSCVEKTCFMTAEILITGITQGANALHIPKSAVCVWMILWLIMMSNKHALGLSESTRIEYVEKKKETRKYVNQGPVYTMARCSFFLKIY